MQLLLATTNKGKIAELNQLLGDQDFEVVGLGSLATNEEIETGATFEENALLKAHYYHRLTGMITIADDSGLEVKALGGAPGIYSARYGGAQATDGDRFMKLLGALQGVKGEDRSARFVCAIAVVWQGGEVVFIDEARGVILEAPRGEGGFGYDPVFYYESLGKTFAELTPDEKSQISHRGRAATQLKAWLAKSGLLDRAGSVLQSTTPTSDSKASVT